MPDILHWAKIKRRKLENMIIMIGVVSLLEASTQAVAVYKLFKYGTVKDINA